MKLYEIDNQIMNCIDEETGEIIDIEKFESLQMEREQKIENIALWYKNLCADVAAYKAEKESFAEKERVAKNKAESLKRFLDSVLSGNPFKTTKVAVSYRKSISVEIDDISKIDNKYLRFREPEADKTLIKEALKNGEIIEGAQLIEKQNIQIK